MGKQTVAYQVDSESYLLQKPKTFEMLLEQNAMELQNIHVYVWEYYRKHLPHFKDSKTNLFNLDSSSLRFFSRV